MELQAVVVERGDRIHDLPAQLLELERIVADEVLLQALDRHLGRLATAAHLAEAGPPRVGIELDDGADEAAPMGAVRMAERRFERDRDRGGAEIGDLHLVPSLSSRGAPLSGRSRPPSTTSVAPVTNEARSEARNATASATSRGAAIRPSGCMPRTVLMSASGWGSSPTTERSMGVSTLPGATALTRTPSPAKSSAMLRVSPIRACLPVV